MRKAPLKQRPVVWYIAAGYLRAGGIEAYLCNYATEIRNHGFTPRIIVFEPLPDEPHRFLSALRAEGIPIESLYGSVGVRAKVAAWVTYVPWRMRVFWRRLLSEGVTAPSALSSTTQQPNNSTTFPSLLIYWRKRLAVRKLKRMLACEQPDVIHVKGRLISEVWPVLPPGRTLFHIATSGHCDASWTPLEITAFREFARHCASVLAPGTLVAETFKKEFGVTRPVDVVFTMVPDRLVSETGSTPRPLRFGILCRFSYEKSIPTILEALQLIRVQGEEVPFLFAGEGDLEDEIRGTVQRAGLKKVRIERVVSAHMSLKEIDVFLHPSSSEAMPVSIVEALLEGIPCIVTPVGGVPDLIRDGKEGFVVPVGDAVALAKAMERFSEMPQAEYESYRQQARARYEECCRPAAVGGCVAGIYKAIMGG